MANSSNRKMEVFYNESTKPTMITSFHNFLDFNSRGEVILGTLNVYDKDRRGNVYHYKKFEDIAESNYSSFHLTDSVPVEGIFIDDKHILVADQNNFLSFLTLPEDENEKSMHLTDLIETNSTTKGLAMWENCYKLVTGCGDSISTLSLDDPTVFRLQKSYSNDHTKRVTSVDVDPTQLNIFFSTSDDDKVCMWDDRAPEVSSLLYVPDSDVMNAVACNPVDSNMVAAGSVSGDIYLFDKRIPLECVSCYTYFDDPINRLMFNNFDKLAVCGDNKKVVVLTAEEYELSDLYINHEHEDFVRGLVWWEDDLYTCGYDSKCLKHTEAQFSMLY